MNWVGSLLSGLLSVGGKMIQDKDKQAEYAFKIAEMGNDLALKLLDVKTYPLVDAIVKLAYASEAILKGLLRPAGAALMTGFLVYAEIKGMELSPELKVIFGAAFPGWMASRHQEKKRKRVDENDIGW